MSVKSSAPQTALRHNSFNSAIIATLGCKLPNKRFNPTYAAGGFGWCLSRRSRGIRGLTWALDGQKGQPCVRGKHQVA